MEQNNKLIAEFMGMTYYIPNDDSLMVEKAPIGVLVTPTKSLEYHKSWDWLMPVVQKIGDEYLNTPFNELNNKVNTWTLEDTYNAVVEFFKNQND
mgnify:CR=1 FL=1